MKADCFERVEILRQKELEMGIREFRDCAFGLFEHCRTHIALMLVQERFGRFLTTEGYRNASAVK